MYITVLKLSVYSQHHYAKQESHHFTVHMYVYAVFTVQTYGGHMLSISAASVINARICILYQ